MHDDCCVFFKNIYIINIDENSIRKDYQIYFVQFTVIEYQNFV